MSKTQWNHVKGAIKHHYGLHRPVTDDEAKAEVASLKRKHAKGNLDYFDEMLYSALSVGPYAIDLA